MPFIFSSLPYSPPSSLADNCSQTKISVQGLGIEVSGRALASHAQQPAFSLHHCKRSSLQVTLRMPAIPVLSRQRRENHCEFTVSLVHMVRSKPSRAMNFSQDYSNSKEQQQKKTPTKTALKISISWGLERSSIGKRTECSYKGLRFNSQQFTTIYNSSHKRSDAFF